MKNLIKLAFIALSSICFNAVGTAQNIPQAIPADHLLSNFEAHGKVKNIKYIYNDPASANLKLLFNEQGLLTELHSFNSYKKQGYRNTYFYDAAGKRTATYAESLTDSVTGTNKHPTSFFIYDKTGKLTAQNSSKSKKLKSGTSYTYDANGVVAKKSGFYNGALSDLYEYKYDAKGQLIETTHYTCTPKCEYSYKLEYTYNDKGLLVGEKSSFGTNKQFSYNEKGQVLAEVCTKDEKADYNKAYSYNEKGQLLKVKHTTVSKGVETANVSSYEYDGQGNWVTRKDELGADNSTRTTTRVIEYY